MFCGDDIGSLLSVQTVFYCQKFAWKPLNYNSLKLKGRSELMRLFGGDKICGYV